MNRTVHSLICVALAATLAGCTSTQGDPNAVVASEQGSTGEERNENTSIDPLGTAPTDPPAEEDVQFLEELGVNDHGNIPVNEEEQAVFKDPSSDTEFAEFTASDVTTDFHCTADEAQPPVNGQYVALKFDINASDDLPESGFPYFYLTVHEFRAWDAEGQTVVDPVGNAESCIAADERVPSPVDPGEEVSGLVVLDVPEGAGAASFTMGGYQGSYGWEWKW